MYRDNWNPVKVAVCKADPHFGTGLMLTAIRNRWQSGEVVRLCENEPTGSGKTRHSYLKCEDGTITFNVCVANSRGFVEYTDTITLAYLAIREQKRAEWRMLHNLHVYASRTINYMITSRGGGL